jgi:hypothetical protein
LTVRDLRLMRACEDQVAIFAREWPDGVTLTETALLRAVELRLCLEWFSKWALSAALKNDYDAKDDALWADYETKRARALWAVLPTGGAE